MANQTQMFLTALLLGAGVGVVYDFFRVTRVAFSLSRLAIALQDLLFFLLTALVVFRYFLEQSSGEVRLFALIGVFLGWVLYFFSVGALVMRVSGVIISFFRALMTALLVPVKKIAEMAKQFLKFVLKPLITQKNRLISCVHLLYNKPISKRWWCAWQPKKQKNQGKKKNAPPLIR